MSAKHTALSTKRANTKQAIVFVFGILLIGMGAAGDLMAEEGARKSFTNLLASNQEHPVKARIIQKHEWAQPGRLTQIGIYFELQPGWHIYAEDPGDAGMPTRVEWKTPKSVSLGKSDWPKPHKFEDAGNIHTFGYKDDVVFTQNIALKGIQLDQPSILLRAEAQWLACKQVCVPGSAVLEAILPVNTLEIPGLSEDAQLFEKYGSK